MGNVVRFTATCVATVDFFITMVPSGDALAYKHPFVSRFTAFLTETSIPCVRNSVFDFTTSAAFTLGPFMGLVTNTTTAKTQTTLPFMHSEPTQQPQIIDNPQLGVEKTILSLQIHVLSFFYVHIVSFNLVYWHCYVIGAHLPARTVFRGMMDM